MPYDGVEGPVWGMGPVATDAGSSESQRNGFMVMRHSGSGWSMAKRSALGTALALSVVAAAHGQSGPPPVSTEQLSSSQRDAIGAFVTRHVDALQDASSATEAFAAQSALVSHMRSDGGRITVEYRQEVSKSVSPLDDLVSGVDAAKAVCALVIAGELAVRPADRLILAGLRDDDEAVRVAAAGAAKRMIQILAAAPENQKSFRDPGKRLQRDLAQALEQEDSAAAARAMLDALASSEEDDEFQVNGGELLTQALEAQAERLRAMPLAHSMSPAWGRTLMWGFGETRRVLIEANPSRQVSNEAKRRAARMSGLVLAMVKAKTAQDPQDAARLAELVSAAEQLLLLVEANLAGAAGQQVAAPAFERGADGDGWQGFQDAVDSWVGPRGRLTREPFGFAAADF